MENLYDYKNVFKRNQLHLVQTSGECNHLIFPNKMIW